MWNDLTLIIELGIIATGATLTGRLILIKLGVLSWLTRYAIIAKVIDCELCFNFWSSLVGAMAIAALTGFYATTLLAWLCIAFPASFFINQVLIYLRNNA